MDQESQPQTSQIHKLPKFLTTVTPLSKILAAILFVTFPFAGFYLGIVYKKSITPNCIVTTNSISASITPEPDSVSTDTKEVGGIKIQDGNVYLQPKQGKQVLIADKNNLSDERFISPIEFTEAVLSPDKGKIMLFAQQGVTSDALAYTDLDKISVKYIHSVSQAVWSNNSRYIAYTSKIADAGGNYLLGIYDTGTDSNLVLPRKPTTDGGDMYSINSWLQDDSGLSVHYKTQNEIPYGDIVAEGDKTISLSEFVLE